MELKSYLLTERRRLTTLRANWPTIVSEFKRRSVLDREKISLTVGWHSRARKALISESRGTALADPLVDEETTILAAAGSIRMEPSAFDIRALAKRINQRRKEYNRHHRENPVSITPAMSRILENDEEYIPYRSRTKGRKRRPPAMNPSIATVVEIAATLETTVGDLLGEPAYRVTVVDRRRIREFVRYLMELLDLDSAEL